MKTVKVAFGIPTEGHSPPESSQGIRQMCFRHGVISTESRLLNKDTQFEFFDMTAGRMFTPMARESLAEKAMNIGADYLLMIDDDMIGPFDLFERLYRHNVDIVAPLAFTRNPPHLAVLYQINEGWDPVNHRQFITSEWIKNWPRKKLVECDAVGFGAVLINMNVLKKLPRPWFMCSSGTGEDIWFCHRAKADAGARIFMDTTFELGHIGSPIIIDTETHDRYADTKEVDKVYGVYKKYGVFDVSHFEQTDGNKEPEILAL